MELDVKSVEEIVRELNALEIETESDGLSLELHE